MSADTLNYASKPTTPSWPSRFWRNFSYSALVILIVATFVASGSGPTTLNRICDRCAAFQTAESFSLFGIEFSCGNHVSPGVISECLEKQNGSPCVHKWRGFGHNSWWQRGCGNGGTAMHFRSHIDVPGMDKILMNRLASDPAFEARLRKGLQTDVEADSLRDDLLAELFASLKTRTAAGP